MNNVILNFTWIALSLIIILIAVIAFKEISKELKKSTNLRHKIFMLKYAKIIAVVFIISMSLSIVNYISIIIKILLG